MWENSTDDTCMYIFDFSPSHLKGEHALRSVCEEINQVFRQADITSDTREAITREINRIWGDEVETTRYAVRSSASGKYNLIITFSSILK